MDKKLINIGDINRNKGKFKRQIETQFIENNLNSVVTSFINNCNYDESEIKLNANMINEYFESGKFYDDFFIKLKESIENNRCYKTFHDDGVMYLYELTISSVIMEGMLNNYLRSLYEHYAFGLYREGGFKSYITDMLNKQNMYINFMTTDVKERTLYFECQVLLSEGLLYDKLDSYYKLLSI